VICLLAYIYLAVATAVHRDSHADLEIGLIPVTIPELVRLLRDTVIPPPCRDRPHRQVNIQLLPARRLGLCSERCFRPDTPG